MKILMLSLYFYPDQTGVPKYSGEMAKWLADQGHDVTVIAGVPHYPDWKRAPGSPLLKPKTETWGNVTIHRVPHYVPGDGKINTIKRMLIDASYLGAAGLKLIESTLKREQYDVAIAICPPLFSGILALAKRLLDGVPWVFHIQDFQVDAAMRLNLLNIGPVGQILYQMEGGLLKSANRVTSITNAMCRRAVAKGATDQRVIVSPNWADVKNIKPMPRENEFRQAFGAGPDDIVALYAGAMGAKQGLDLVLDTAEALIDQPKFKFVMVGGGPEWRRLCTEAGERGLSNVQFVPLQPLEKLPLMLAAADVHLVVQKAEAADIVMPSKLTNILASGRATIATANTGTALADAIEQSGAGLVTPPEDCDALFKALMHLESEPEATRIMGHKARAFAEATLDRDVIMQAFEKELRAIAESSSERRRWLLP